MTTIYRKSADWLTVSEAKRLLIDALPTQDAVDFFVMPDGSIKVERNQESKLGATFVDGDFIDACEKVGIKPRMTHRPAITDYKATGYDDVIYSITHEEFVRYAELHGVSVEVEQPAQVAQPAPAAQVEPEVPDPERRLKRLREMGGSADYFMGKWRFKGINELVAVEASEGRPRSSQKTVKADLEKAAEAERKAKKEGVTASPFPN